MAEHYLDKLFGPRAQGMGHPFFLNSLGANLGPTLVVETNVKTAHYTSMAFTRTALTN